MKDLFDRVFGHWKSSLIAVIIAGASYMCFTKQIDVSEWIAIMGSLGAVYALLMKDDSINKTPGAN